ncbi:MAG TPA: DUF72 domain-containing protein [Chloroflexota bacterium]|nr:DUF72 domain-containing protein [Chloroflexota bacterium]
MARLYLGTSGWAYPEWKGKFYPAKMPGDQMLPFYGSHFDAVELNNSFYRMPKPEAIAKWRDAVPEGFRFALKAPQEITHRRRLLDAEQPVSRFVELANLMGERRGPLLFQLPPNLRADVDRLSAFLGVLARLGQQVAFEFRHASWLDEPVFDLLRQHDAALCLAETDEEAAPLLPASGFVYLRLRKSDYSEDELKAWRDKLSTLVADGRDVYCFFKHESSAKGPQYVLSVMREMAAT